MNETYLKRHEDTASRKLGDETIIMSVKDSRVFSLNQTASLLWSAADGVTTLREIVARCVVPEFEIDGETAYSDALELVGQLAHEGILLVSDQPISGALS